LISSTAAAVEFSGPAEWRTVHTNAVRAWQAEQRAALPPEDVWNGVVTDKRRGEVRLLAEAVGHRTGVTAEFLLVGPMSDRAYESAAVTVASPGDIARAVVALGVARGGGVGSRPFRFWPCGERVSMKVRRVDGKGAVRELQSLVCDAEPSAPLFGEGGLVFAGGRWDSAMTCATDTNLPCSVISLYNEPGTIFDVPFQVGQSEVYGRLTLAEQLPYGALLEIAIKPLLPPDGKARVMPLTVEARPDGGQVAMTVSRAGETVLSAGLTETLNWMRDRAEEGRELYVTVVIDDAMPLRRAVDVARVFCMLDGKGIKLDGKANNGLFPKAFLPQEKWRERAGRNPQPFELHVSAEASERPARRLVFIEEDWNVEGLDPKLTPREYPFEKWEELPALVSRASGADNKVPLLFVFAPADLPLGAFMPGVRAVSERLPLVYVFAE